MRLAMKKLVLIATLLAAAATQSFAQVVPEPGLTHDPDPFIQGQIERDAQWLKGGD
jgi:hypothetical protein